MKKLIYTILASSFLLSCSSDSANDNSNNPSSTGMLVKTVTEEGVTTTVNYNGNKVINTSSTDGQNHTFTYSGNLVTQVEGSGSLFNDTQTFSYSNNLIISDNLIFNTSDESYNRTYTYNSDGSITENLTYTNTDPTNNFSQISKLYYLQGNLIKEEIYSPYNSIPTLEKTITYTYDNKNTPYKSATGFLAIIPNTKNNVISEITKNSSNIVTESVQYSYQYNSNDYPLDCIKVRTPYSIIPQTTTSIPGAPTTTTVYYTYY